jgi:hypothetical protein
MDLKFKFMNIKPIFNGFLNLFLSLFIKLKNRKIYETRLNICYSCSYITENKLQCSICGCILKAKTKVNYELDENKKSIDGCPKKYW